MHPRASHLEWISINIRRPRSTSDAVSAFEQEHSQPFESSIPRSCEAAVACANDDDIVLRFGGYNIRGWCYDAERGDSSNEARRGRPCVSVAGGHDDVRGNLRGWRFSSGADMFFGGQQAQIAAASRSSSDSAAMPTKGSGIKHGSPGTHFVSEHAS